MRTTGDAARTHCAAGHELTPDNTRYLKGGGRKCRTCVRAWAKGYRERRTAG